jgi:outer membrane protein assembly factor BamA
VKRYLFKFVATLLFLCVTGATVARSQEQPAAKASKIGSITVSGTQKYPTDQILAASGLKIGDTVTAPQIQEAADRLAALGVFSAVNFRYSVKRDAPDEIALEFQVREGPTFPILFDNFPWFSDAELAEAIRSDLGLFTGESPDSGAMVDEIGSVLANLVASKKVKGTITHQLIGQVVGDGMMMQFRLEGPPLNVQSVQFGDPVASASEPLKDRVPDITRHPYSRFAIEIFENEHVRPLYDSKGFLRAQIGPPKPTLTVDVVDPAMPGVDVLIPVTPGPVYSWKGVSWQGNSAIATANLNGAVELKPGDNADGTKIEFLWQKIQSEYMRHGYLDSKVTPQSQFDETAHQVAYHVSIDEGPQYHMGELIVTGLSVDAEKRLRRVWLLAPGQVFDKGYFDNIVKDLSKPSPDIFGEMPIHYTKFGHLLRPNPEQHTVDVLMDFK